MVSKDVFESSLGYKSIQEAGKKSLSYNELDEDEKVALAVAILFPHRSLKEVLPKLFKSGWSLSTYYSRHSQGYYKLKNNRGLLDEKGLPTDMAFEIMPPDVLLSMTKDLSKELRLLEGERQEQESKRTKSEMELQAEIRILKEKFDLTRYYEQLRSSLPGSLQDTIDKAIERFKEGDCDSAILKAYQVSEVLARNLFKALYGDEVAHRVGKQENRLKKIWNDEQLEKDKYPGIQVIASLLTVILWYRNKMAAHVELAPTIEAARTCLLALLQAIHELQRLGLLQVQARDEPQ